MAGKRSDLMNIPVSSGEIGDLDPPSPDSFCILS